MRVGGLAHQHLAAQAERLDARRQVHLLADHREGAIGIRADQAGHHGAGADADPDEDLRQLVFPMLRAQPVHRDLHLHRAQQRALGMVARRRNARRETPP